MIRCLSACLILMIVTCNDPLQAQVQAVSPRSCSPGKTTRLTLRGQGLDESLRIIASQPSAKIEFKTIKPTQAIAELTLPADAPLGSMGLWIRHANGPQEPLSIVVDDLPIVIDEGKNHTVQTAQPIATLAAISGTCETGQRDHYRFTVAANQRLSFAVHTQSLHSAVDPVLRLLDADGNVLRVADDNLLGPECQFSHRFKVAGDYYLQIHDNRYSAGDYHLRVGDFPILTHPVPLAVRVGHATELRFVGPDGTDAERVTIHPSRLTVGDTSMMSVSARFPGGKSATWLPVMLSQHPLHDEFSFPTDDASLTIPSLIVGQLSEPQASDSYRITGQKDQRVRVSARTRSLGCPTLLNMQLFDSSGQQVAQTEIGEADEWSFDFTFPRDGEYRLQVFDLLHRGGEAFGYCVEIAPSPLFSLAIKPDAKGRELFACEADGGACAVDLEVDRFGYDGAIELSLLESPLGLSILNPHVPAKAKQARIYLVADQNWQAESIQLVRLLGSQLTNDGSGKPPFSTLVNSQAIRRVKTPFMLETPAWRRDTLALGGVAKEPSPFRLEPQTSLQFARPTRVHPATLTLHRTNKAFKDPITLLPNGLPEGWHVTVKTEQDHSVATFTRKVVQGDESLQLEPDAISVLAYAEFQGRGRIETFDLPIEWIDPVEVALESEAVWVAGGTAVLRIKLQRRGNDPQPVEVSLTGLPPGVTAKESIIVAAEETEVELQLSIASTAAAQADARVSVSAKNTYFGQAYAVNSSPVSVSLMAAPQRLEVFPPSISLHGERSRGQLVVTGYDQHGVPRDWTRDAKMEVTDAQIAVIRDGVVFPLANGETKIDMDIAGKRMTVPIQVTDMGSTLPVQFESEVLVALSKQGCNSGACHGSPSGKGGFRLSLRSFDKSLDSLTLIREDFGRRINPLEPAKSLLLVKPTMQVAHGGGKQLRQEDEAYRILHEWIAGGSRPDDPQTARCERLSVYPDRKRVLSLTGGQQQQVSVWAHFSDGTQRDVTHLVAYESSDASVATVDTQGLVSALRQGEAVILARFLEHIESIPLMFVDHDDSFQWSSPPPHNYIDKWVNAKLRQLQYLPSETCTDAEFLRRVFLDVIGLLPTIEETTAFLADESPHKRARLVDALLEREEYAKFWALKWGDLLQMTSKTIGVEGVYKYHRWIEQTLRENLPYDQFAMQLLTASGSTLANPPANFYRAASERDECVETISQVFLGARLQCAKCHNHPFERWTQDNYYALGTFFQHIARRTTQRPGEMFIYHVDSGDVVHPRTGETMQPWLPSVGNAMAPDHEDRRQVFATWLIDPENPYFARIESNRIWSQLFTRGIVDPIDDFRDSNPPSNGPLLDALTADFVDSGFDRKHLLRTIIASRTYQASCQTNDSNRGDQLYFSHQEPRLLIAESLLDAINQTLELEQPLGTLPRGTKATQLPAPDLADVDFLKVFGQPERSTVCACERVEESNLAMAIELFNGATVHEKLRDPKNRFRRSLAAGKSPAETIRELYLAALSRPPSTAELEVALAHCAKRNDLAAGIEDVCWALFNIDEFLFQH